MRTEVKICGLGRGTDARVAASAGADYLGIVFAAEGPRRRSPGEAARIWSGLPTPRVGVFVDPDFGEVADLVEELRLAVVQLHGSESPSSCRRVADETGARVWKAVRLRSPRDLDEALGRYGPHVGGLVLEGWSTLGLGGVGARFDWGWATERRSKWPSGLQLILAGGLTAGNVRAAIDAVRPDVVDVSSGVEEAPGRKDARAVRSFLLEARRAGR